MTPSLNTAIYVVDLVGTASFAFSGALRAADRRPDLVGMLILAAATAAGGSVFRDVVLNHDVAMLRDGGYPAVILVATVLTFFFPSSVLRRERLFKYSDAVGLGIFSAFTASYAWQTPGIHPLAVLFVATAAGCAGGVVRDLIIRKDTLVLTNELYVTPMIVGTAALMGVEMLGGGRLAGFFTALGVTTLIRLLAIRFDWRLPRLAAGTEEAGPAPGAGARRPEDERVVTDRLQQKE
jgi:uncharacterized membrane protein YeiH